MKILSLLTAALLVAGAASSPAAAGEPPGIPPTTSTVSLGTIDYLRSIDSVREYAKPKRFWGKLLE